jgi:hypothetical protein
MNTRGADERRWPELKSAKEIACDGKNPMTGRVCILGHHNGFHKDDTGAEWLDEGDEELGPNHWENSPEPWHTKCKEAFDEGFDGGIGEAVGFIDILLNNNPGPAFTRSEIQKLRNDIAREAERPESA